MPRACGRRLNLTLHQDELDRLAVHAREVGRPLAAVARRLLLHGLDHDDPRTAGAALDRDPSRLLELQAEVARLQTQLDEARGAAELIATLPRWRWPLISLLADREWWHEWLPRLGELLGRDLRYEPAYGERQAPPVVDERGYADLMTYLFPVVRDEHRATVPWHSPEYARCARIAWDRHQTGTASLSARPDRAEVWEPVVRHVALALSALESTSQTPADAYTHLRVEAEIRGEWLSTLGALLGEGVSQRPGHLPSQQLP